MKDSSETDPASNGKQTPQRIVIFRREDSVPLAESGAEETAAVDSVTLEGFTAMADAGLHDGHSERLLFQAPGMSLIYAWFRSGFPLPRHSHNADCVYYIVSGTIQFGTATLSAGDGFFVPAEAAYTYMIGPEGVEVLEFRTDNRFDTKILVKNASYYTKAAEFVAQHRDAWRTEKPPVRALTKEEGLAAKGHA